MLTIKTNILKILIYNEQTFKNIHFCSLAKITEKLVKHKRKCISNKATKHLSRTVVAPRVHFAVFGQCQRVVAAASHPGHPRVDELGHQEGGIPHSGNSAADLRVHVVPPAVHFSFCGSWYEKFRINYIYVSNYSLKS